MNRRMRIAGAIVVALVMLGVNGVVAAGAGAADQEGYRTKVVDDADVKVSYPRGWTVVPITARELARSRKRLAKQNPELVKQFDEASGEQLLEAARFRATDLSVTRYRPSLAVATVETHFPSPEEFELLRVQFRQVGFGVMDTSRPKVGHDKGYRIDLSRSLNLPDGTVVPVRLTELLVPGGKGLTFVAVVAEATPDGIALIDDLIGRVRPA